MVELGIVKNQKETYSFVNEYFNFIGGVRILDIMTREQIKSETIRILKDLASGTTSISVDKKRKILL